VTTVERPASVVSRTSGPRPHQARATGHAHRHSAYVFVVPFMVVFLAMFIAPLAYSFYLSLYRTQLVGGSGFVGLANYRTALTDHSFLAGIGRILQFFVYQVPIMLVLAVAFALLLDSGKLRVPRLFRIAFFVPYAVPAVVGALIWGYLYGPKFGPFQQIAAHFGTNAPGFLTSGGILPSIANIATWEFCGYNMIIFYAALRAIPTEQFEAASVDGAGAWRTALNIKLPQLKPALLLTLVFSVIGSFQLFNEPSVLQPVAGAVISSDLTPNFYAYTLAFVNQNVNYAAAISFLLGFVIVVATSVVLIVTSQRSKRA